MHICIFRCIHSLCLSLFLSVSLSANVLNHTRTREGVTHKHIHTRTQARTDARAHTRTRTHTYSHTPCIVMEAAIARASPEGTRACGADCRCGNSPPHFLYLAHAFIRTSAPAHRHGCMHIHTQRWSYCKRPSPPIYTHEHKHAYQARIPHIYAYMHACVHTPNMPVCRHADMPLCMHAGIHT